MNQFTDTSWQLISNSGVKKYTSSDKSTTYLDQEKIEQDAL
jgi:hypothetical protein